LTGGAQHPLINEINANALRKTNYQLKDGGVLTGFKGNKRNYILKN
jgi:hypothetical protein